MKPVTTLLSGVILPLAILTLTGAVPGSAAAADSPIPPDAVVIDQLKIEQSLTGVAGDAAAGRKIFANKKQGNCLACHMNSELSDQQFHGKIGPLLDGAGTRWSEAQLRTIVVNAKAVFTSQTVMPGFYSLEVGENVRKDLIGKTILSAQEVEDVVAYLATLK